MIYDINPQKKHIWNIIPAGYFWLYQPVLNAETSAEGTSSHAPAGSWCSQRNRSGFHWDGSNPPCD